MFGNQVLSDGQWLFDTVRRFNGQQADAVILTDVGPRESRPREDLAVLFCRMTRATVRLEIVCDGSSRWNREMLMPAA